MFGKSIAILFFLVGILSGDPITQPLGIAGDYLTTSVGIGIPPQYFDLGIDLNSDELIVLDTATQNPDLDYYYDFIKSLLAPEVSDTINKTTLICRRRYVDSNGYKYYADGHYALDQITFSDQLFPTNVRFCDLDSSRTSITSVSTDPISWLMYLSIDGFLGLKPGGENVLKKLIPADQPKQVTLYVNKNAIEVDNSGLITLGGKNTANCGTFKTFPSDDSDSFTAWATGASFNGVTEGGTFAILFDLTFNGLIVPKSVYNDISYYFGSPTSFYCSSYDSPPDLQITIYGTIYKIPIKQYISPTYVGSYYCALSISYSDTTDDNQFVIGRTFLNSYCFFLDYDESSIGLADAK